jgi:hypothetical protein
MAYNGSGTFSRVHNWATDKTNTVAVTASRMDAEDDGFATGLTTAVCKDGQTTCTARIPFVLGAGAFVGAVSGVSYAFINDPNTGLYSPAADQWALAAGGTQTLLSTSTALTATGTFTCTGAIAGASVAATNALTGATVTVTGALSAATATGAVVATQAQMETGTATDLLVPVGRLKNHPLVAKAWGFVTYSGGTPSLIASAGVTGIADNGVGNCRVTMSTAASAETAYMVMTSFVQTLTRVATIVSTKVSTSIFDVITYSATSETDTDTNAADIDFSFVVFGDL